MGESRGRVVVSAVLVSVAVSFGALIGRTGAPDPQSTTVSEPVHVPAPGAETVRLHVSGMVVSPGVVDVPVDAIVADAIDAAGGLRSDAVVDQINLAAPVVPGGQIVVPGGDAGSDLPAVDGDGILALNGATAGELEALPGVGPVLAERIVAFREENGGFDVVEDLLQVPGIGEAKLAAIRDLVRP